MVVVITRSTMPTQPICTKVLTRKRPMPAGLIAKLHSFFASNSAACLSFITARQSMDVCCAVSACCDTGVILPSKIGRASCREGVEIAAVGGVVQTKEEEE